MSIPINLEGKLSTSFEPIVAPLSSKTTKITSMIFNNDDDMIPYTIEVSKVLYNGTAIPMYKIQLDPGDIMYDTIGYLLDDSTSIIAKSDSTTTNYVINGEVQ